MEETHAFVVSDINEDHQLLRDRFQELGYLYLKKYVGTEDCEDMLTSFLDLLKPYVIRDINSQQPTLCGEPFSETDPIWDEVYPKIQSLEQFHRFFHQDHIINLMKMITGDEVFVYPIKMARISTPRKIGHETPPHQDAYSHHAGPTMAGIWVALQDISEPMGRVKVLSKSHKRGVRPVYPVQGVGGIQCEIYPGETDWHVSDYEQGDVLIFHSRCVHKAEPNRTQDTVRMSIDTRFCDYGAPVFSTNLEPHHGWRIDKLNWETIYKNWQSERYQYYWRDYPNLF